MDIIYTVKEFPRKKKQKDKMSIQNVHQSQFILQKQKKKLINTNLVKLNFMEK